MTLWNPEKPGSSCGSSCACGPQMSIDWPMPMGARTSTDQGCGHDMFAAGSHVLETLDRNI